MKIIQIMVILMLFIRIPIYSQTHPHDEEIQALLEKSQKQKTTGMILTLAGPASFGLGYLIGYNASIFDNDPKAGIAAILILGGIVSTSIGIPILISSSSTANKAANLSLQTGSIPHPIKVQETLKSYPAIGINIPINSIKP